MRRILAASLVCLAFPAAAEVPQVVADIAPVQSLVAQVMGDLGTPGLLVAPGTSPHGYSLRPSEARRLSQAGVVIWIGPDQTPWLAESLPTLAPEATSLPLLGAGGSLVLPTRHETAFGEADGHDHDAAHDGHEDGHENGHAGHGDGDGHGDHDHDHDHDHGAAHGADDGHHHGIHDPHAWLDPDNARRWLALIAESLANADPANAETYRANAAAADRRLVDLTATLEQELSGITGNYITFHDAYQYFEHRFGLPSAGAISTSDAVSPGPARLADLRNDVAEHGITCVFAEPQFNPHRVETLANDLDLRTGTLDPLGARLEPGPEQYADLLTGIADSLLACLKP